jgi:hypothetical protein
MRRLRGRLDRAEHRQALRPAIPPSGPLRAERTDHPAAGRRRLAPAASLASPKDPTASPPGRGVGALGRRSARPQPSRASRAGLPRSIQVVQVEGAGRLAMPRWSALAFAAVGERVFVVYASFASGAEPQVMGVASSGTRAAELAQRYIEEDRCAWRRPDWLEWDSARRVHSAVDGRGPPSRYGWWTSVSMNSSTSCWSPNRSSRSTSVAPQTGRRGGVGDRGQAMEGGASSPAGEHGAHRAAPRSPCSGTRAEASMPNMSTDPGARDGAVPPASVRVTEERADAPSSAIMVDHELGGC